MRITEQDDKGIGNLWRPGLSGIRLGPFIPGGTSQFVRCTLQPSVA